MTWLASMTALPGYQLVVGLVLGITIGLWADRVFRAREKPLPNAPEQPGGASQQPVATGVVLRLLLRNEQDPLELSNTNVWRWQVSAIVGHHEGDPPEQLRPVHTYVFLTFDAPIPPLYRRVTCEKAGVRAAIGDLTARSAVVVLSGDPTGAVLDMAFSAKPV